ncbi:segregation/condensation protein A [Streptomyces massasporeus]|uniref:segregation and condensation protein A n=1 Tax=Streptomyces massasporeus TaxID=67324 RepID=UPI00367EBA99
MAPPADVAGPSARPVEAVGPLAPPVEAAGATARLAEAVGPSAPPADAAGITAPPVGVAGPMAPPADVAGPSAPPVEAAGPLAPPADAVGPSAPPADAAGITAPPVGVAGPMAPPADVAGPVGGGVSRGAGAETRPADVVTAFDRPSAPAPSQPPPPGTTDAAADDGVFKVRLANFEGPFDLLLQLISRHKMDVTEVALSKVTDEFMAHIRAMGPDWDLDETTEFLVVAATLLDLKAARLLPAAEVEDEGDLALLEARDLLFARLLQYRAYKQIADIFSGRLDDEARRYPRTVGLEAHHAELLPDVVISIGAEGFAKLAVKAMQPRPKPQVYVDHIHAPLVSVQEQAQIVVARLRELGEASFRALVADTDDTLTVVARFLALLELYREKAVALEQETALGDLLVRWTGGDGDETPTVTDEFDRPPEPPKEEKKA